MNSSRWEISPAAAEPPLHVYGIKLHQQYETPPEVMAAVRRLWAPTVDAMATPLSAICPRYVTREDDVLSAEIIPRGSIIYCNPAYAVEGHATGSAGIEVHLTKLIDVDVGERGSTLVALLPGLTNLQWYERTVGRSDEVYYIRGELVFANTYRDLQKKSNAGFLWQRPYILAVWRPGERAPGAPTHSYLTVDACEEERLHIRCCGRCGRVRILPRCASAELRDADPAIFLCASSPDERYGGCDKVEYVLRGEA